MNRKQQLTAKTPLKGSVTLRTKSPLSQGKALRQKPTSRKLTKPTATKSSVSHLKKVADKWFSLATRYRFAELRGGEWMAQCITCTIKDWKPLKSLQCGHFMSRAHNATRYSEENTAPQCYGCNVMQQGRQYAFGLEIDLLYGDGTAKRLYKEAKTPLQFKREDLEAIIDENKSIVRYYETQIIK